MKIKQERLSECCGFSFRSGYDFPGVRNLFRIAGVPKLAGHFLYVRGQFSWVGTQGRYREAALVLKPLSVDVLAEAAEAAERHEPAQMDALLLPFACILRNPRWSDEASPHYDPFYEGEWMLARIVESRP